MTVRAKTKAALLTLAIDAAGLSGAGLVSYGTWSIYPPAGLIAAGAFLLAGAWLNARGA